jgi:hypothetical protein
MVSGRLCVNLRRGRLRAAWARAVAARGPQTGDVERAHKVLDLRDFAHRRWRLRTSPLGAARHRRRASSARIVAAHRHRSSRRQATN